MTELDRPGRWHLTAWSALLHYPSAEICGLSVRPPLTGFACRGVLNGALPWILTTRTAAFVLHSLTARFADPL